MYGQSMTLLRMFFWKVASFYACTSIFFLVFLFSLIGLKQHKMQREKRVISSRKQNQRSWHIYYLVRYQEAFLTQPPSSPQCRGWVSVHPRPELG